MPNKYKYQQSSSRGCAKSSSGSIFVVTAIFLGCWAASFPAGAAEPERTPVSSREELYQLDNFLKIEITLQPDEWNRQRFSWRGQDVKEEDGKEVVFERDYEHVPGNVVINGVEVKNVGIRKKGFVGSMSSSRPSLKIKFDKYEKDQEFAGVSDITLNNNKQDPTLLHQYLSYQWFRKAGIVAPRCNFAELYVNGRFLGVYSNVEPVTKSFLKKNFGSSKGRLYESTAADFQEDDFVHFDTKTKKKSDDRKDLKEIARLLEDPDSVDLSKLGKLVDLDKFINFWATEMLLGHWDGYAGNRNNYFIYQNPKTGLFEFIPWGTDGAFGEKNPFIKLETAKIIHAKGRLCAALYGDPAYRERYLERVAHLIDNWWDADQILSEIETLSERFRPSIHVRENAYDEAIGKLRDYIVGLEEIIRSELVDPPTEWLVPPAEPRAPIGTRKVGWAGTVKSTFLVPFGTYDTKNPTPLNPDSLQIEWRGEPVDFPSVIASAGIDVPDPQWFDLPQLLVARHSPELGRTVWLWLSTDFDLLRETHRAELGFRTIPAYFGTSVEGTSGSIPHGSLRGELRVEFVDIDGVEHIRGSLDARIEGFRDTLKFE